MNVLLEIWPPSAHLLGIRFELESLKRLADLMETTLKTRQEDFEDYVKAQVANCPQESRDEFYEFFSEEHSEHYCSHPQATRYAIWISACSIVESNLIDVLDEPTPVGSRSPPTLERIKTGLKAAWKLEVSDFNTNWNSIRDIFEVRNCIVHAGGNVAQMQSPEKVKGSVRQLKSESVILDSRYNPKYWNESAPKLLQSLKEQHESNLKVELHDGYQDKLFGSFVTFLDEISNPGDAKWENRRT